MGVNIVVIFPSWNGAVFAGAVRITVKHLWTCRGVFILMPTVFFFLFFFFFYGMNDGYLSDLCLYEDTPVEMFP